MLIDNARTTDLFKCFSQESIGAPLYLTTEISLRELFWQRFFMYVELIEPARLEMQLSSHQKLWTCVHEHKRGVPWARNRSRKCMKRETLKDTRSSERILNPVSRSCTSKQCRLLFSWTRVYKSSYKWLSCARNVFLNEITVVLWI